MFINVAWSECLLLGAVAYITNDNALHAPKSGLVTRAKL